MAIIEPTTLGILTGIDAFGYEGLYVMKPETGTCSSGLFYALDCCFIPFFYITRICKRKKRANLDFYPRPYENSYEIYLRFVGLIQPMGREQTYPTVTHFG